MTIIRLIIREAQHAAFNTLLSLGTVTVAVALLVAMVSLSRASVDATRKAMKQLGFNLLIVPNGTDPARYQSLDFQGAVMPESNVHELAQNSMLATHYVGKLQRTIEIGGQQFVLTGQAAEESAVSRGQKKPMPSAYIVPPGKVFLGAHASRALEVEIGDTITVLDKEFTVDRVNPDTGIIPDDIRIYMDLHEAQALLGQPGVINAIDALSCQCPVDAKDLIAAVSKDINEILPDVKVEPYQSILLARHHMRVMMDRLAYITLAIVIVGAALAIWALTFQSVRNRRREIGVLRALGIPGWRIALLFIGKILVYAILGAWIGYIAGFAAASQINVVDATLKKPTDLLPLLLIATPIFAALFGAGPILGGLLRNPDDLLREEAP